MTSLLGVDLLGPYNEHLLTDIGALYLGFGLLFAWATVTLGRELALAACAGWALTQLLHFTYHAMHLTNFTFTQAIEQTAGLAAYLLLVLATALLVGRLTRCHRTRGMRPRRRRLGSGPTARALRRGTGWLVGDGGSRLGQDAGRRGRSLTRCSQVSKLGWVAHDVDLVDAAIADGERDDAQDAFALDYESGCTVDWDQLSADQRSLACQGSSDTGDAFGAGEDGAGGGD